MPCSPPEAGFSVWFDSLSDDDQRAAVEWLRNKVKELRIVTIAAVVDTKKPACIHGALNSLACRFPQCRIN